ncbi:MAG: DUF523 domain-containing protein [Candidatus Aenigmatarchaeota archaeon]
MKLCSACLLGIRCRYDEKIKPNEKVLDLTKNEVLIPICPEQLGGLPTPRADAEIKGGDGLDVLDGKAKVVEPDGNDVTEYFVKGAKEVLKLAKLYDIKEAILKQRSPSCGSGQMYDGTFSKSLIEGDGVTSALLKRNGIKVISEEDL